MAGTFSQFTSLFPIEDSMAHKSSEIVMKLDLSKSLFQFHFFTVCCFVPACVHFRSESLSVHELQNKRKKGEEQMKAECIVICFSTLLSLTGAQSGMRGKKRIEKKRK